MAFTKANLSLVGQGPIKLWLYRTPDTSATVWTTGYFRDSDSNAPTGFTAGDVIFMCLLDNGDCAFAATCVSTVASTYVTLARKTGFYQCIGYE